MKSSLLGRLAELDRLSHASLKDRWRRLFGSEPPAYGRQFLMRRLAYRIQELAFGGLSPEHQLRMEKMVSAQGIAENAHRSLSTRTNGANPAHPPHGTRIVREWRGRLYEVVVTNEGFEFEGSRYRSLSAIAKVITGTHWNGPVFFGVREGKKRKGTS